MSLPVTGMWPSFINSLIISIPGTVIPILVAAYAAFAFAWMKFPGRDALFILVVALLVVPVQMTLIPVLRLLTNLQMAGSFPAIWLAHTAYGLPFAIFLLRNFFGALPRELLESAYLDGASNFQVFSRLILPLSVPALASLAIFQFLWVWNDLLVALVILQDPAKAPMTVTITNLVSSLRNSVAVADLGRLHLHDTPPGPFLRPAALLRAGYTDRSGEGLVS